MQNEVIGATLADDYGLEVCFRETTTICVERPVGIGGAVGSLLVRSHDRSQRLYDAMLARGYDGEVKTLSRYEVKAVDLAKSGMFILLAAVLVGIEWWR